jgi:hypothetical protein
MDVQNYGIEEEKPTFSGYSTQAHLVEALGFQSEGKCFDSL